MDTISICAYLHRLLPFFIVSSFSINVHRRRPTCVGFVQYTTVVVANTVDCMLTFRSHLMSIILKLFVLYATFKSNNHRNMKRIFHFQSTCLDAMLTKRFCEQKNKTKIWRFSMWSSNLTYNIKYIYSHNGSGLIFKSLVNS